MNENALCSEDELCYNYESSVEELENTIKPFL